MSPRLPGDAKLKWSGKPHRLRYNASGQQPRMSDLLPRLLALPIGTDEPCNVRKLQGAFVFQHI
ncbi:hypothetical protein ACFPT7_24600 [Acidicapsa dinghuensis]|uniref:Uncharacterized protein n=1 Tax=Acidicapsa dinghuensis TaxID=2218256 RepID=A0ABW1ENB8_9BACT|nr:hypothetical protein [Acidicapsa dinghuensis]